MVRGKQSPRHGELPAFQPMFMRGLLLALWVLSAVALGKETVSEQAPLGSGVIKVVPEHAKFDRELTVTVRDFDGWLIDLIRTYRMVSARHFTAENFRMWLDMLPPRKTVADWGEWRSNTWSAMMDKRGELEQRKAELDKKREQQRQRTEADKKRRLEQPQAPDKPPTAEPPKTEPDKPPAIEQQQAEELKSAAAAYAAYEREADAWEAKMAALRAYMALRKEVRASLYLILGNGRLKHVQPQFVDIHGERQDGRTIDKFTFILRNDPADNEEWDKLIRGAQRRVQVQVRLGVDLEASQYTINRAADEKPKETDAPFYFITYGAESLAAGLGLVLAAFICCLWLAAKTDLLRDPDIPRRPDGTKQFSLARCQTAFWFFLFIGGYVFLAVVKRETNNLTDQCLVLLGISTGTMLGANFITKSLGANPPTTTRVYRSRPQRFLYELLSDGERLTFYRFQMVVWTLVLGMVFVKSVWVFLQMPVYGVNELALMGISAGSYLAFKFPEAKAQGGAATP